MTWKRTGIGSINNLARGNHHIHRSPKNSNDNTNSPDSHPAAIPVLRLPTAVTFAFSIYVRICSLMFSACNSLFYRSITSCSSFVMLLHRRISPLLNGAYNPLRILVYHRYKDEYSCTRRRTGPILLDYSLRLSTPFCTIFRAGLVVKRHSVGPPEMMWLAVLELSENSRHPNVICWK